jgi:hypothetical protein
MFNACSEAKHPGVQRSAQVYFGLALTRLGGVDFASHNMLSQRSKNHEP